MEDDPEKKLRVLDDEDTEEILRLGDQKEPEVVEHVLVPPKPEEPERLAQAGNVEDFDRRSIEPDIDAIIGLGEDEALEEDLEWMSPGERKPVPYGWFVVVFLVIATLVTTALVLILRSMGDDANVAGQVAVERLEKDEEEDAEAAALVESVEEVLRKYVTAESVAGILPLVRDPERVKPLMEDWYARHPMEPQEFDGLGVFQPLDIDGRLFWLVTCLVKGAEAETILMEQTQGGKVLVDWETHVCYQPMSWDRYAGERSMSRVMDFRVYLQPDYGGFYSHEFSDESKWLVYRLTAKGSEEYLFGYVLRDSELAGRLAGLIRGNRGHPVALYLRLELPEGTTSPRGVVIREILSERWALVGELENE